MSEPDAELLPTVTLQHRYGEQRMLANRADYVSGREDRFRNWLLSDDDPELKPAPCRSVPPSLTPAPPTALPQRTRRRKRRGRRS